jgi:transposase-like protein
VGINNKQYTSSFFLQRYEKIIVTFQNILSIIWDKHQPAMKTQFKNVIQLLDYFKEESTCRELLELQRWNGKPFCPHCGHEKVYRTNRGFKCAEPKCYKKFSVTVGTIFENSKIPLRTWFASIYLHTAHKKGISSHQLGRDLGISQKTAWFVLQRVRAMLKDKAPTMLEGTIECDETYVGGKEKNKHKSTRSERLVNGKLPRTSGSAKAMVFGLFERDGKKVVNHVIPETTSKYILQLIYKGVKEGSAMKTDDLFLYRGVTRLGYNHVYVRHNVGEYVVGDTHTANIDCYWSQLKRGIIGIYHSTSRKHLHRYCDEFAFRYNTRQLEDTERFIQVLTKIADERITWKQLIK